MKWRVSRSGALVWGTVLALACSSELDLVPSPPSATGSGSGMGGSPASGAATSSGSQTFVADDIGSIEDYEPPSWDELFQLGGAGGESGLGTAKAPDQDRRPEREETRTPNVSHLGAPGWRESEDRFCSHEPDVAKVSLWADAAGIALQIESPPYVFDGHGVAFWFPQLWYNNGSGWEFIALSPTGLGGLRGGDLVVETGAGITSIQRDGSFGAPLEPAATYGMLLSDRDAVHVLSGKQFHRFDSKGWSRGQKVNTSTAISSAWVGPQGTFLGTSDAVYQLNENGDLTALANIPGPAEYTGLVTTDDGKLWIADAQGNIYVQDGGSPRPIRRETTGLYDNFVGFWSDGQAAYYLTEREFGRAHEDSVEVFATAEDSSFAAIAGASQNEIFLAARQTEDDYRCDGLFLFHFDGAELHLF